jgi:SAM-dependent methyltransferase
MADEQPQPVGQAWEAAFASQTNPYQLEGGLSFIRKFIRAPHIQHVLRYAPLPPAARMLDAGCGSAKYALTFSVLGYSSVALDYSLKILQTVEHNRARLEQETGPLKFSTHHGDLERLNLPDSSFDVVMNDGVVEHWLDQATRRQVLAEMARVTTTGGVMAVIIPNGSHPRMPYWVKNHPAFLSAPPMVNYSPALLVSDLTAVGLTNLYIDGIYAWRTVGEWPYNHKFLRLLGSALDHFFFLPRAARLRWGLHLIGVGRKA